MNKIGALFDLDGVLIDSEHEYTRIWSEVHSLFPTKFEDMPMRIKGMTLDNIIRTYYGSYSPTEEQRLRDTLHDLESKMVYRWLPGAKEFLEWLIAENIPRVMVTSSDGEKMAHLRSQLPEIESMMSAIVTADRISRSKPDPEGYLLGSSLINVDAQHCAVFEDSLQGVKAGHAAGAYVVGVAGTLPSKVLAPYSDIVVDSLSEIDKVAIINILINGKDMA